MKRCGIRDVKEQAVAISIGIVDALQSTRLCYEASKLAMKRALNCYQPDIY